MDISLSLIKLCHCMVGVTIKSLRDDKNLNEKYKLIADFFVMVKIISLNLTHRVGSNAELIQSTP